MFRQFRSSDQWVGSYGRDTAVPVDRRDALLIGRAVYALPEPHMVAVQWYYVQRTSVTQGRRALACTAEALARYVTDARQMLVNRDIDSRCASSVYTAPQPTRTSIRPAHPS
ncbi:MAG: hypothetical protein RL030_1772 [Pseudomonadota bacterium]|jgi:hypothetical protein